MFGMLENLCLFAGSAARQYSRRILPNLSPGAKPGLHCTTLHLRQPENICIVIDWAQQGPQGENTIERVQVTQVPQATSFQATRQQSPPRSELRVPEHVELVHATRRPKQQSPPRNQPLVLQQGPPAAFDNLFHLDRTAREL